MGLQGQNRDLGCHVPLPRRLHRLATIYWQLGLDIVLALDQKLQLDESEVLEATNFYPTQLNLRFIIVTRLHQLELDQYLLMIAYPASAGVFAAPIPTLAHHLSDWNLVCSDYWVS